MVYQQTGFYCQVRPNSYSGVRILLCGNGHLHHVDHLQSSQYDYQSHLMINIYQPFDMTNHM